MFSQFDGNAAFSGGGFMPSQSFQSTDPGYSSSSKNRDSQVLLPLTVKQIKDASNPNDEKSNIVVDGVDVNNIKLVGMVSDRVERATDVSFSIDDGTGRLVCHRWLNESIDSKEMEQIQDGMYVRVHGALKVFQGKIQLDAFSIRPVTNFNEIAYHFIECIYVHLYNSKLQMKGSAQTQPHATNSATGRNLSTGYQGAGLTGYQGAVPNQVSEQQYSCDGISGTSKMVLDYLQLPTNLAGDAGVHINELAQHLKVPLQKIRESIGLLENEGVIYTTIDENHYKSALNG